MAADVNPWSFTAGLAAALLEEFGESCTVYADSIPQHFRTPSFYVRQISGSFTQIRGRRYRLDVVVVVTYFPPEHGRDTQENMLSALSRLYPSLEFIRGEDGLPIQARSMTHEMTDSELHVELSYALPVFRAHDRGPKMTVLEQMQHVKEVTNGQK